jgi:type III pantothenate kinase
MILEFDIGNTTLKWRLLDIAGAVIKRGRLGSVAQLPEIEGSLEGVTRIRVSSVATPATAATLDKWVRSRLGPGIELAQAEGACAGLTNSYAEPERMGVDRWLAMLAAYVPRGRAVLVIDAGTALTLDFIDAGGQHRGGYILPGQVLSQDALLRETSRVRFTEDSIVCALPGRSTAEAVRNGALFSLVAAATAAARQARSFWGDDFAAVITGGDGEVVHDHLVAAGEVCEFVPDLVFEGLGFALP